MKLNNNKTTNYGNRKIIYADAGKWLNESDF
jgi:hypothetical protein